MTVQRRSAAPGRRPSRDLRDMAYVLTPLVVLLAIAADAPLDAFVALAVAGLVGVSSWRLDGSVPGAFLAAGVGVLFTKGPVTGAASIVLLVAVLVVLASGFLWAYLAVAAAGLVLPLGPAPVLAALALALWLGWPDRASSRSGAVGWLRWAGGVAVVAASLVLVRPVWVVPVGFVAGAIARFVAHQPANAGLGRAAVTAGGWLAALPAVGFLVLAALGRWPGTDALVTIGAAYAAVAVGVLVFAGLLGVEVALRSGGPLQGWSVACATAVAGLAAAGALQGAAAGLVVPLAVGMPLLAPAVGLGLRRLVAASPRPGLGALSVGLALGAMVAVFRQVW